MTLEAKIVTFGSFAIIFMLFIIVLLAFTKDDSAWATQRCKMHLAETSNRSLEEIQALCKQP
jgi:hypothetical protein